MNENLEEAGYEKEVFTGAEAGRLLGITSAKLSRQFFFNEDGERLRVLETLIRRSRDGAG